MKWIVIGAAIIVGGWWAYERHAETQTRADCTRTAVIAWQEYARTLKSDENPDGDAWIEAKVGHCMRINGYEQR
jgi:hypothetical protein